MTTADELKEAVKEGISEALQAEKSKNCQSAGIAPGYPDQSAYLNVNASKAKGGFIFNRNHTEAEIFTDKDALKAAILAQVDAFLAPEAF